MCNNNCSCNCDTIAAALGVGCLVYWGLTMCGPYPEIAEWIAWAKEPAVWGVAHAWVAWSVVVWAYMLIYGAWVLARAVARRA